MNKLLVYLVCCDSAYKAKRDTGSTMKLLTDHLGQCHKYLKTYAKDIEKNNLIHAVLVAPEYFFTSHEKGCRKSLDEKDKNLIVQQLVKLSKKYPAILIVPGTIFYKEIKLHTQPAEKKEALEHMVLAELQRKIISKNAGVSIPWDYSHHTKIDIPKAIGKMKKEDDLKLLRNTSYLLLNGKIYGVYDKHTGFSEAQGMHPDKSVFMPGTTTRSPTIGGFKCSIEICFDHCNGVLKLCNPTDIDFQIVVSDYVDNNWGNVVIKENGYFIHSSTENSQRCVVTKDSTGLVYVKETLKKADYLIYLCDVDDRKP